MYQLILDFDGIRRTRDGMAIQNGKSREWREYQAWLDEDNEPLPADQPDLIEVIASNSKLIKNAAQEAHNRNVTNSAEVNTAHKGQVLVWMDDGEPSNPQARDYLWASVESTAQTETGNTTSIFEVLTAWKVDIPALDAILREIQLAYRIGVLNVEQANSVNEANTAAQTAINGLSEI